MAYPYRPGQYPTQSSAAYGAYWPQPTAGANQPSSPANQLVWVVLLLGLATYIVSYAAPAPGGTGWGVRFSALAAIVATLDLLPPQGAHTKLMAALAAMGFLDALSQLITADQNRGWATIVIVIFVALQALTAIAILLTQLRAFGETDRGLAPYDPYAYYAQASQQYYAAQNQQPQQQPVHAQGTARAEAATTAQAQHSAAERDALYAEYLSAPQPGASRAAASPNSGERTQNAQPASGTSVPTTGPVESIRPGNEPAGGSPTQSFP